MKQTTSVSGTFCLKKVPNIRGRGRIGREYEEEEMERDKSAKERRMRQTP
jgi:hypothetical protein